MNLKNLTSIIFILVFALNSTAQNEDKTKTISPLITDRPDQTESADLVPKGLLQIETGAFYESSNSDKINNEARTFNSTLLRFGLLETLELRVGVNLTEQTRSISGSKMNVIKAGFSPLLFGTKIGILEEKGLLPKIGLLGHLSLPFFASKDYKTRNTGVDFRFSFAHTLNEKSSLSYNLGAVWQDDSPEAIFIYTLAYGLNITERIGSFVEIYGDLPENRVSDHYWDAGFTYLLKENIQLDISGGTAFNNNAQDLFLSAGISIRTQRKKK